MKAHYPKRAYGLSRYFKVYQSEQKFFCIAVLKLATTLFY